MGAGFLHRPTARLQTVQMEEGAPRWEGWGALSEGTQAAETDQGEGTYT